MGCDGPAIGVDLGTTYSCVAVWRPSHNRVEVVPNDQGNLTTPSCVAFTDAWRLVGDAALNQAARNPVNTVFGYIPSYGIDPFVVITHSDGGQGAFGYWVYPLGDGCSGYLQPVWMAVM
ncbi:heat shock 70 kDa protein 18-like [Triticum dicoccoides]|uniref:heat shock 70 kDa protein 18-like n=1 Tax=Triticum dicoccoides TaxID=85692 RepID=UPI00188FEC3A|nr:heat shock 70 kDa protein 18-like [Triticum dicoccoides]